MGFGTAVMTCLRKYAVFNGRARRSEYWYFVLFSLATEIAASLIDSTIRGVAAGFVPVSLPVWLALLLPSLAVTVRRVRDTNRSGWWVAGFYVDCVVVLGAAVPFMEMFREGAIGPVWLFLAVAVLIVPYAIFLFVLTVLPGTSGTNHYGPDPKAPMVDVF